MIFEYFNPTSPSPHPLIIYFKFTWIHTLNLFIKILKGIDDGDRKDPDSLSEWIAGKSFLSNTALEWPFSSWCWPVHRRHLISPHFLHFLFIQSPSTDCMGSHPEPPLHLQPYVLATCQSWISWSTTGPYFSTFYQCFQNRTGDRTGKVIGSRFTVGPAVEPLSNRYWTGDVINI